MGDVANRDEAFKCLDIATAALQAGDHARAERFSGKALKLFRCSKTEAMVLRVQVYISEMTRGHDSGSGRPAPPGGATSNGAAGSHHRSHHTAAANGTHSSNHADQQQQQRHHTSSSSRPSQQQHRQQPQSQQPRGMGGSEGLRQRGGGASAAAAAEEAPEDASVTPEQRRLVAHILKATCYYDVLAVPKSAGDADIKQAYKKLALRLHPDKNKARKADEAFKLLSRAFSCLSSPDKRAYYDRTGYESSSAAQTAAAGRQRSRAAASGGSGGGGFFYSGPDDFDPEEIFNAFFGAGAFHPHAARAFRSQFGGYPGSHHQHAGGGARGQRPGGSRADQQQQTQLMALIQILPVLLIVAVTLLSSQGEPVYSLAKADGKFGAELATARLGVPFWVKDAAAFDSSYPPASHKRIALERQVETDVYEAVYQRCQAERMAQHRAYTWGNRDAARKMELAACGELGRLNERMGSYSKQQQTIRAR